jgi:hypothetical protein
MRQTLSTAFHYFKLKQKTAEVYTVLQSRTNSLLTHVLRLKQWGSSGNMATFPLWSGSFVTHPPPCLNITTANCMSVLGRGHLPLLWSSWAIGITEDRHCRRKSACHPGQSDGVPTDAEREAQVRPDPDNRRRDVTQPDNDEGTCSNRARKSCTSLRFFRCPFTVGTTLVAKLMKTYNTSRDSHLCNQMFASYLYYRIFERVL